MEKKFCKQCGSALTKTGARFCTICGAIVDGAENSDIASRETAVLPGQQTDQAVAATEVLSAQPTSSNYETEEMPQMKITARAEQSGTAVVSDAPVTKPQKKREEAAPDTERPGGRKKLLLAASVGVAVLSIALFLFLVSRRASETQAESQPPAEAQSTTPTQSVTHQPDQQPDQQSGQPSGAGANDQAQSQTGSQAGSVMGAAKSPALHKVEVTLNQQRTAEAKPTPTTAQEKQPAAGTTGAEQSLNQGKAYLNARRYQEALAEFERARNLDPGNKDVYYLIGSAYQGMNQFERAAEAYRQCTSGIYASVAQSALRNLSKKVGRVNER